jgi:hypothetical protein
LLIWKGYENNLVENFKQTNMNIEDLHLAINECDNGQVIFNLGNSRSFFYNKKWYPLRATINRARELNQEPELTTDRALLELCLTLDYIKIGEINFMNYFPVPIDQSEVIKEVQKIANVLKALTE